MRVLDVLSPNFQIKYDTLVNSHKDLLDKYGYDYASVLPEMEKEWLQSLELLKQFTCIDSEYEVNQFFIEGKKILAEGAQGTLLDVDFGSYPFVTSSNTVAAGAFTGLGVAPQKCGKVIGIVKAYCTRVGSGPFPTELFDEIGEKLRKQGFEFGSTTGRPRRCGWLDLVALKYSIMINGVTDIVLTKADVMNNFDTIKVCTSYKIDGKICDRFPSEIDSIIEPQYIEFKGWKSNITEVHNYSDLPLECKTYIEFIEKETGVKVSIVSTGPDRSETIIR